MHQISQSRRGEWHSPFYRQDTNFKLEFHTVVKNPYPYPPIPTLLLIARIQGLFRIFFSLIKNGLYVNYKKKNNFVLFFKTLCGP